MSLLDSYDATIKANSELLAGVDDALVESGRAIAGRVDEAIATGEGQEVTKALYLIPHLMNVLREMHATPKSRLDAGIAGSAKDAASKLGKLRSVHGKSA